MMHSEVVDTMSMRVRAAKKVLLEVFARVDPAIFISTSPRLLGYGKEGVVFTNGVLVMKVLDSRDLLNSTIETLSLLIGRFHPERRRHIYSISAVHRASAHGSAVVVYPYEESLPYHGGRGSDLVDLLCEFYFEGLICNNLHPDNLRVVSSVAPTGCVRFIDYGRDIQISQAEDKFEQMCCRAYLSWRYWYRDDLKALMRRALQERNFPELDGFERFSRAVQLRSGRISLLDPLGDRLAYLSAARILVVGSSSSLDILSSLAARGCYVVVNTAVAEADAEKVQLRKIGVHCTSRLPREQFDVAVLLSDALARDAQRLPQLLSDLRNITESLVLCTTSPTSPFLHTPHSSPMDIPADIEPEVCFTWTQRVHPSGSALRAYHLPERVLLMLLARSEWRTVHRTEVRTVDTDRFEPAIESVVWELKSSPHTVAADTTLLIKACAMDAAMLESRVRHLIAQLVQPREFAERILVIDSKTSGFTRAYATPDMALTHEVADMLVRQQYIDRVVYAAAGEQAERVNAMWFGLRGCSATHAENGAQVASTLMGFGCCQTRYVLQMDVDLIIGRQVDTYDYLHHMTAILRSDPLGLTVSFNIPDNIDHPFTHTNGSSPWRIEVRNCVLDLKLLEKNLPLPNESLNEGRVLQRSWHRSLDLHIANLGLHSYRGGSRSTYFIHPQNSWKSAENVALMQFITAVTEANGNTVPSMQLGQVDLQGNYQDWLCAHRFEEFVFVILGRNTAAGRFSRCIESLSRQLGSEACGAIVIDDNSSVEASSTAQLRILKNLFGERGTFIRTRSRRGGMANLHTCITNICGNPETIIVTLDADDCLLGDMVIESLRKVYAGGCLLTVGSMLRTDKFSTYQVNFENPRAVRGGCVWQHLRSFKKKLYDRIPLSYLKIDDKIVDLAYDWAFMLPMAELAGPQFCRHITTPLYLYEPSGEGKGEERRAREVIIGQIVDKPTLREGS